MNAKAAAGSAIETRYADAGGVKIAYQVSGAGPDLLMVPGATSHVDLWWGEPMRRRFLRRLSSFSRLVRYDKRGTGASDPVTEPPDLEQRIEEVEAVRAASGCESPVVLGFSEGGPIAIAYAVRYPERVSALILYGSFARKPPQWLFKKLAPRFVKGWGTGLSVEIFSPSLLGDTAVLEQTAALERASASPAMFAAGAFAMAHSEVRALLPKVTAPTLVIHRRDEVIPVAEARRIARGIPGARLVELDGIDHHPWVGDVDSILEPIEQFVREHGQSGRSSEVPATRPRRPVSGWASLTPAEARVVRLAAKGVSNSDIAATLFISRLTVETHLKRVFSKLGVASRSELADIALRSA